MAPPEVLYLCITPDNTPVVVLDEGTALYMTGHGQVYEAHLLVDGPNGIDLRTAPTMRIASLEAEVQRLTAALAEAEERAAGPFVASCDEIEHVEYGRRLGPVLDVLCEALGEYLVQDYDPDVWATVVAGWECKVEHGVHLSPCLDDDDELAFCMESRQGVWRYDLRLTVTDGRPVITAERRGEGAR